MAYKTKKEIKSALHRCLTSLSPQRGWSSYFPFLRSLGEWLGAPPKVPKNELARVETPLTQYELHVSEKDPTISPRIYANHIWEKHVTEVFENTLKSGDVVIDIGAHMGYYSILAGLRVRSGGKVFSFEPDMLNMELLKKNIQRNELGAVVEPIHRAVGHVNEVLKLYLCQKDDSSNRVLFETGEAKESVDIECVRVADYLKQYHPKDFERIRVVKMDIEGFEPFAAKGMEEILRRDDLILFTEVNFQRLKQAGSSAEKYLNQLIDYGFSLSVIEPHGEKRLRSVEIPELLKDQIDHIDLYCTKEK